MTMYEFEKKMKAVLLIASTLNPLSIMELSVKLEEMARLKDEEVWDGSQLNDSDA